MFTRLIESQRARERSAGGTAASVFAHAGVIGFFTWATLGAAPGAHVPVDPPGIIYTPVTTAPPHGPVAPNTPPSHCVDCIPMPDIPVPTLTPLNGAGPVPDDPSIFFPVGTPGGATGTGPGTGDGGCVDCIYETADVLAHPLSGNAAPVYP